MNHLRPYPAYKDSGVSWLREVPEHWEIRSLGSLTRPLNQRGSPDLPLLSVVREKGIVLRSSMSDEENRNYVPDDLSNYKVVRKGNLAINKMKAWQGSMGIAPQDGIVSPAYFVYDFNIADLNFGHALLRSRPYVALFAMVSDGVRVGQWDLSPAGMKRIPVLTPPLPEQNTIVRYLDYIDKRIRRYINAKKKLIALLNEQKQAIIHQALTRGLDPNIRLKPSGVEWLRDIPEHWEVLRIKRIARINPSRSNGNQLRDPEELVVFLPMERVTAQGKVDCSEFRHIKEVRQGFSHFRKGDVVVAKITPCFENGKGAYLDKLPTDIGFGTTEFIVLRAGPEIEGEYLYLLTALAQFRLLGVESMTGSAGQQRVSPDFVANFTVGLPPIHEQQEILRTITCGNADYSAAITHAQNEIELLREYRTRLIADVVTGKLDIREVAPSLNEESLELEDLDEDIDSGEMLGSDESELVNEAADADD